MGRRCIRTPARRARFLDVLAATRTVTLAAAAAGAARESFYRWRHADPAFAADWDTALESITDVLESEAARHTLEALGRRVLHRGLELARLGENAATPRRRAPAAENHLDWQDEEDMTDEEVDARIAELLRKAGVEESEGDQEEAPGAPEN